MDGKECDRIKKIEKVEKVKISFFIVPISAFPSYFVRNHLKLFTICIQVFPSVSLRHILMCIYANVLQRAKKMKTGYGLLWGIALETRGGTRLAIARVSQCMALGSISYRAGTNSGGMAQLMLMKAPPYTIIKIDISIIVARICSQIMPTTMPRLRMIIMGRENIKRERLPITFWIQNIPMRMNKNWIELMMTGVQQPRVGLKVFTNCPPWISKTLPPQNCLTTHIWTAIRQALNFFCLKVNSSTSSISVTYLNSLFVCDFRATWFSFLKEAYLSPLSSQTIFNVISFISSPLSAAFSFSPLCYPTASISEFKSSSPWCMSALYSCTYSRNISSTCCSRQNYLIIFMAPSLSSFSSISVGVSDPKKKMSRDCRTEKTPVMERMILQLISTLKLLRISSITMTTITPTIFPKLKNSPNNLLNSLGAISLRQVGAMQAQTPMEMPQMNLPMARVQRYGRLIRITAPMLTRVKIYIPASLLNFLMRLAERITPTTDPIGRAPISSDCASKAPMAVMWYFSTMISLGTEVIYLMPQPSIMALMEIMSPIRMTLSQLLSLGCLTYSLLVLEFDPFTTSGYIDSGSWAQS